MHSISESGLVERMERVLKWCEQAREGGRVRPERQAGCLRKAGRVRAEYLREAGRVPIGALYMKDRCRRENPSDGWRAE